MSATWVIDGARAHLNVPGLSAWIDSKQPAAGLTSLEVRGGICDARLLGIGGAALDSASRTLVDWHVRGDDLNLTYEIGEPHAARIDIVWNATAAKDSGNAEPWFARIDLLVSVRTDRLDWRHDVFTRSEIPAAKSGKPAHSQGNCWTFPLDRCSYVEIAHPADLRRDELLPCGCGPVSFRLERHLFPHGSLEKGVILRARARGLFLSANATVETVDACYAQFIAADPVLSV